MRLATRCLSGILEGLGEPEDRPPARPTTFSLFAMRWSIKLAKVAGIEVRMHLTFLLLLAWIAVIYYRQGGTPAMVPSKQSTSAEATAPRAEK